jgi:hypothetical protein
VESRKIWYVIPCGNEKLSHAAPARELYQGRMFKHTLENVEIAAGFDREDGHDVEIVIMSALHGLVRLGEVLEPYDATLPRRKKPAPEYVAMLREQAEQLGIGWDNAEVYALLPKPYLVALDEALRELDVYVQDVYEGCAGVGDQRHVNCSIAMPAPYIDPDAPWTPPAVDQVEPAAPAPLTVWIGADTPAFAWGEPFLVNYGRLLKLAKLPRATAPWVLDSRAFTELMENGGWRFTAAEYAADVMRYATEIGQLEWVAPQDWPAASRVLAVTGLTALEHQTRTTASVVTLRELLGDTVHVLAVVTGEELEDYLRHIEMYSAAGIDLTRERLVGVGALVGRPAGEVARIIRALYAAGVTRMHGFGLKTGVLALVGHLLVSTDSTDWQREGRYDVGLCRHEGSRVRWETNCPQYAREWRARQQAIAARAGIPVEAPALAEYVQEMLPFDLAA